MIVVNQKVDMSLDYTAVCVQLLQTLWVTVLAKNNERNAPDSAALAYQNILH